MDMDYQAFWSYTHEDDERLRGYVSRLAERIGDEFAVSSGDDLAIFLDRNSLEWGDTWRSKIDDAIGSAPLFIAIITPKFVKSLECRRELLNFVAEAKSRGFSGLLLPILLIGVPGMNEESEDEVLALLARTQYVDWTNLRLQSEESPAVLAAVNSVALRIMKLQEEAQSHLQAMETRDEKGEQEALDHIFSEIGSRLPHWLEAVDFDPIARAQWNAAWIMRSQRAQRLLDQRRGVSGPFLGVWSRLGMDVAPLSQARLEQARIYHRLTIELDPFVTAAFRLIEREPQLAQLLDDLREGVAEAMLSITGEEASDRWSADLSACKYSTALQNAVADLDASEHFVVEANEIVSQWNQRIQGLFSAKANGSGPSEHPASNEEPLGIEGNGPTGND